MKIQSNFKKKNILGQSLCLLLQATTAKKKSLRGHVSTASKSTKGKTITPGRCIHERSAAAALGYNQVSWDNLSGKEEQPASEYKYWAELNDAEKAAAKVLGYNEKIWDNKSGSEPQPPSAAKGWAQLTTCDDGNGIPIPKH